MAIHTQVKVSCCRFPDHRSSSTQCLFHSDLPRACKTHPMNIVKWPRRPHSYWCVIHSPVNLYTSLCTVTGVYIVKWPRRPHSYWCAIHSPVNLYTSLCTVTGVYIVKWPRRPHSYWCVIHSPVNLYTSLCTVTGVYTVYTVIPEINAVFY